MVDPSLLLAMSMYPFLHQRLIRFRRLRQIVCRNAATWFNQTCYARHFYCYCCLSKNVLFHCFLLIAHIWSTSNLQIKKNFIICLRVSITGTFWLSLDFTINHFIRIILFYVDIYINIYTALIIIFFYNYYYLLKMKSNDITSFVI